MKKEYLASCLTDMQPLAYLRPSRSFNGQWTFIIVANGGVRKEEYRDFFEWPFHRVSAVPHSVLLSWEMRIADGTFNVGDLKGSAYGFLAGEEDEHTGCPPAPRRTQEEILSILAPVIKAGCEESWVFLPSRNESMGVSVYHSYESMLQGTLHLFETSPFSDWEKEDLEEIYRGAFENCVRGVAYSYHRAGDKECIPMPVSGVSKIPVFEPFNLNLRPVIEIDTNLGVQVICSAALGYYTRILSRECYTNEWRLPLDGWRRVDSNIVETFFSDIRRCRIPALPEDYFGFDGHTTKITVRADGNLISLSWWCEGPKEWSEVIGVVNDFKKKIREFLIVRSTVEDSLITFDSDGIRKEETMNLELLKKRKSIGDRT